MSYRSIPSHFSGATQNPPVQIGIPSIIFALLGFGVTLLRNRTMEDIYSSIFVNIIIITEIYFNTISAIEFTLTSVGSS